MHRWPCLPGSNTLVILASIRLCKHLPQAALCFQTSRQRIQHTRTSHEDYHEDHIFPRILRDLLWGYTKKTAPPNNLSPPGARQALIPRACQHSYRPLEPVRHRPTRAIGSACEARHWCGHRPTRQNARHLTIPHRFTNIRHTRTDHLLVTREGYTHPLYLSTPA